MPRRIPVLPGQTVFYGSAQPGPEESPEHGNDAVAPFAAPFEAFMQMLIAPLAFGPDPFTMLAGHAEALENLAQARNMDVRSHSEWGQVKATMTSDQLRERNIFGE